ncbi:SWI/SNF chromatin-remodeling complex subunit [Coemansia sp. RSA 1199]|nr:SWI/SNF chromatin-remodeling complex subunit [Coemansia sp. RSA 1199]
MSGFGANGTDASGGSDAKPEDFLNFSQTASMFMGSGADSSLDDVWNLGDTTNIFFNMEAFNSAPASAGDSQASMAPPTSAQASLPTVDGTQTSGGMDLGALGFEAGPSVDADAWQMLMQGDPALNDMFSGFGSDAGPSSVSAVAAPTSLAPPAASGTLAPADLDALSRQQRAPPPPVKSPTPSAKKPRQPKPKKAAAPKGDKSKAKAKKAATPKLKSPTPQSDAVAKTGPGSPTSDSVRRIKPKADGASVASPTPSAKSVTVSTANPQMQGITGQQVPPRGPSATPSSMANGGQPNIVHPQLFSPTSSVRPPPPQVMTPQQQHALTPQQQQQMLQVSGGGDAAAMFQMPQQSQPMPMSTQQQQTLFLQQQQQQQQQQQNSFLQNFMVLGPAQRQHILQQMHTSGSVHTNPGLVQVMQQQHQLAQQQQHQQQMLQASGALSAGATAGMQSSAFSPGMSMVLSPQQQQQQMLFSTLGAAAGQPVRPPNTSVAGMMTSMPIHNAALNAALTPQQQMSAAVSSAGLQQQASQQSLGSSQSSQPQSAPTSGQQQQLGQQQLSQQQQQLSQQLGQQQQQLGQQQQQRMFTGTNVPMPADMAAEFDRLFAMYRSQMPPGSDMLMIQHSLEQQLLAKYSLQQQARMQSAASTDAANAAGLSAALGTPQVQPASVQQPQQPAAAAVRPMVNSAAQMYAGAPAGLNQHNINQHLALVSMLSPQHTQFMLQQLRTNIPQTFGTMTHEQFVQYLVSGHLVSIPYVNQLLVLILQSAQQQQQRAQQQLLSGAVARPAASMAGLPPGLSPQQQQQQLQLQQLQRAQMLQPQPQPNQMAARPPNPFMSPSMAHTQLPQQVPTPVNRAAATPTPSQTGSQRGVKRKSVNNSPAPQHAQLNKSPRVLSPKKDSSASEPKPDPPDAGTVNGDGLGTAALTSATLATSLAASAEGPSQELLADLAKSIAGSTIAHMSPVASNAEAATNGAAMTATPQPPSSTPAPVMSTAGFSAAMMANLQALSPAQRQLLVAQQQQQQLGQQQQHQQQHQQSQLALSQLMPNFQQLPIQTQTGLIALYSQLQSLSLVMRQYQGALQAPSLTQQQRTAYTHQLGQLQGQQQHLGQQLQQHINMARAPMATAAAATAATSAAASAAAAATASAADANGSNFFLNNVSMGNASEPTANQTALKTEDGSVAASSAVSGGGLEQPAEQQSLAAANFRLEPSPQPTVIATDQIGKVLNTEQQATLGKWQREADRIGRANASRMRETAGYEQRETQYRAVLEAQRVRIGEAAHRMRLEREADKLRCGGGYKGLGNGTTARACTGGAALAPAQQEALVASGVPASAAARWVAPVTLVLPGQRISASGRPLAPHFSRKQLQRQASRREVLVPIRLDIDAEGFRLRDTFTWDLGNELVTPRQFVTGLCADLELPADVFVGAAVQAIEEQLDDYRRYGQTGEDDYSPELLRQMLVDEMRQADDNQNDMVWVDDELRVVVRIDVIIGHIVLRDQLEWDVAPLLRPLMSRELSDELRSLAAAERGRISEVDGCVPDSSEAESGEAAVPQREEIGSPKDESQPPPDAPKEQSQHDADFAGKIRDSDFDARKIREWVDGTLQGHQVTPEHVARVMCAEKRLGGEFETSIAHAIREQLYAYVKSFLLAGYVYRPQLVPRQQAHSRRPITIDDADLAHSVLPPVATALRDLGRTQTFSTLIAHLHTADAERLEKDADREVRRKRRQGRGIGRQARAGVGSAPGTGAAALGGSGPATAAGESSMALPADRTVHRTNRTMIPLPSWFADDLPPGTRSFVDVPGEGAHFLDSYDARAVHEASMLAAQGTSIVVVSATGAADGDDVAAWRNVPMPTGGRSVSQLLGRRQASGAAALGLPGLDVGVAGALGVLGSANSLATPATPATPQQLAREKLRNPTGRPRGRPSILEKALRDAAAARAARVGAAHGFCAGAVPGQLSGRPLEELTTRWRCMCCGLPPDRTPLIRRGPEGMHSLCDVCGQVYADSRIFRDVDVSDINHNMVLPCGLLTVPSDDDMLLSGPDIAHT